MSKYYFQVDVREGSPGWADDDEYISKPYDTFANAYKAMYHFEPRHYWRYLRFVIRIRIWLEGNPVVSVCTCGQCHIQLADLTSLRTTEQEFDDIMAEIDREQGAKSL